LRDIHVAGASIKGRNTVFPAGFLAAGCQSCDNTFIGTNPRHLSPICKSSLKITGTGMDNPGELKQHQQHREKTSPYYFETT